MISTTSLTVILGNIGFCRALHMMPGEKLLKKLNNAEKGDGTSKRAHGFSCLLSHAGPEDRGKFCGSTA